MTQKGRFPVSFSLVTVFFVADAASVRKVANIGAYADYAAH